jgi:hypothetical protein
MSISFDNPSRTKDLKYTPNFNFFSDEMERCDMGDIESRFSDLQLQIFNFHKFKIFVGIVVNMYVSPP